MNYKEVAGYEVNKFFNNAANAAAAVQEQHYKDLMTLVKAAQDAQRKDFVERFEKLIHDSPYKICTVEPK